MRIKKRVLLCIMLFVTVSVMAQKAYQQTANGVKMNNGKVELDVQFLNPATVRVVKSPVGWEYTKESLSVIEQPQKVKLSVGKQGTAIVVRSASMKVMIEPEEGKVSFYDTKGNVLIKEKSGARFTDFDDVGTKTFSVYQPFILDKDEAIYGLGQMQDGRMIQRGFTKYMVQENTEDFIPFIISVKGYGLFWDNYSPTTFTDNEEETSFNSEVGDCVDYYVMVGANADGVIAKMRQLTGQAPMNPLWTYGFWQSKERYKSQAETVDVVRKYRELNVPLDGIIQDWQYWGSNYLWNAMDFLNENFHNPKRMMEEIHGMHAHLGISIWQSFGPETLQFKEMEEKNMLFDFTTWPVSGVSFWPPREEYPSKVKVYDPYNPEARDIYWKYLEKGLFSLGIDAWWMDSTEPDHHNRKPNDINQMTYMGSFRKVRNAFPLMCVSGVYDNQRATSSDKRVYIFTRSAFAGQQRYGANTWTGDINSNWKTLKNQISAGLNFSLCGIPYWNTDIGGFFLSGYNISDLDYKELLVRWTQFGAFCGMMRSHGEGQPREIYQFGKKGEPIFDALEKAIRMRYSFLPYIYSTSWQVTKNQSSLQRALMMDFPHDKDALNINDEFMFGKSILVCPVTEQLYTTKQGRRQFTVDYDHVKSVDVYLPKGTSWYNYWTNERSDGGQHIQCAAPLDKIPLFIKAGSILPMGPDVQYVGEKSWENLELKIYEGANGEFVLYEDEGDNYNYEKGAYTEIPLTWNNASRRLTIGDRKGSYDGMISSRTFTITLQDGSQKTVLYSGKKITVKL